MTMSINNAEKALFFFKYPAPFVIKTLKRLKTERQCLHVVKGAHDKSTAKVTSTRANFWFLTRIVYGLF